MKKPLYGSKVGLGWAGLGWVWLGLAGLGWVRSVFFG
jgi:hypothetical protein